MPPAGPPMPPPGPPVPAAWTAHAAWTGTARRRPGLRFGRAPRGGHVEGVFDRGQGVVTAVRVRR